MKSQIKGFISGALVSALVLGGAVSALAATGRMTITVDPINIQVNGQTFQPTDVNGNAVPVFAYNGTTYAPLRALAEAYGLTVGYDSEKQMATVTDPDAPAPSTSALSNDYSTWSAEKEAAYQEFKEMWEVKKDAGSIFQFVTKRNQIEQYAKGIDKELAYSILKRFAYECYNKVGVSDEKYANISYHDENGEIIIATLCTKDGVTLRVDALWSNLPYTSFQDFANIQL